MDEYDVFVWALATCELVFVCAGLLAVGHESAWMACCQLAAALNKRCFGISTLRMVFKNTGQLHEAVGGWIGGIVLFASPIAR